jgi:hypothetical protein
MRKITRVFGLAVLIAAVLVVALAGTVLAAGNGFTTPAPNSGDGISDGSGFDAVPGSGIAGPAPNAGDGIPDGSGF